MSFVDALERIRKRLDMSMKEAGESIGLSRQWVCYCLNGKKAFSKAHKIAFGAAMSERIGKEVAAHEREIRELKQLKRDLMAAIREEE